MVWIGLDLDVKPQMGKTKTNHSKTSTELQTNSSETLKSGPRYPFLGGLLEGKPKGNHHNETTKRKPPKATKKKPVLTGTRIVDDCEIHFATLQTNRAACQVFTQTGVQEADLASIHSMQLLDFHLLKHLKRVCVIFSGLEGKIEKEEIRTIAKYLALDFPFPDIFLIAA